MRRAHLKSLYRKASILLAGLVILLNSGCAWWLIPPTALPTTLLSTSLSTTAQPVTLITLDGPLATPSAELSGMAWYGDWLILLPQYPAYFGNQLFALHRQDIIDFVAGRNQTPLYPFAIPFLDAGVQEQTALFNGYEAITFIGDRVYLTVESLVGIGAMGYLVAGTIAPDLTEIRLDASQITQIQPQASLPNLSDEALIAVGDQLATIYEANGRFVNPEPVAHFFDSKGLNLIDTLPLPAIEYRITDATDMDSMGRFWVINYFYPGDRALASIMRSRGASGTIDQSAQPIERLLELQFTTEGVIRTATPPLQLELLPDNVARNWEGIVRLQAEDQDGFLLVTDSFPETLFAFVAKP